ncbi:hypothetical protein B7714_08435 [Streptococcus oralis subsp. oralis]|uniref:Uncharacterized protein n=1 Tax=Streptococcus oralis subsp. oralis TaxID=1891914 RepID=A0A1X1HVG9_STROR|nr:hypothetical protein B7714_08435 [Streptococcus oralis subsp. oralis]
MKAILSALRLLFYHVSKICQAFCRIFYFLSFFSDYFCSFLMEILFFLKKISLNLRNQGFYLHFLSFFRENLPDFLYLIYGNRLTYFSFF